MESHFGSLRAAWEAPVTPRSAVSVTRARAITWHDEDYPPRLKEIFDRPPLLYVRGELLPADERSVAIVGTRKPTAYGREVAHRLAYDTARAGVTVVSGLARGIAAIAHRAALEAGERTIAVLGSGVDVIYPKEHTKLAAEVANRGAVVSEHPMGVRPDAQNFPRRNRIMSGMTLGTVVEAGEKSGALIMASHALEQDREVFAVPGNIFSPRSLGANQRLGRQAGMRL